MDKATLEKANIIDAHIRSIEKANRILNRNGAKANDISDEKIATIHIGADAYFDIPLGEAREVLNSLVSKQILKNEDKIEALKFEFSQL